MESVTTIIHKYVRNISLDVYIAGVHSNRVRTENSILDSIRELVQRIFPIEPEP